MRARILVVESSSDVRSVVVEVLRAFGWATVEARSADQAIDALAAEGAGVAAVVVDLAMSDRPCPELASQLRRMAGVPVVLLGDDRSPPEGMPAGITYLRKPFTVQALAEAVRDAMALEARSVGRPTLPVRSSG